MEKCTSDHYLQLFFKLFMSLFSISKLLSKVPTIHTTISRATIEHWWVKRRTCSAHVFLRRLIQHKSNFVETASLFYLLFLLVPSSCGSWTDPPAAEIAPYFPDVPHKSSVMPALTLQTLGTWKRNKAPVPWNPLRSTNLKPFVLLLSLSVCLSLYTDMKPFIPGASKTSLLFWSYHLGEHKWFSSNSSVKILEQKLSFSSVCYVLSIFIKNWTTFGISSSWAEHVLENMWRKNVVQNPYKMFCAKYLS